MLQVADGSQKLLITRCRLRQDCKFVHHTDLFERSPTSVRSAIEVSVGALVWREKWELPPSAQFELEQNVCSSVILPAGVILKSAPLLFAPPFVAVP